jgi:hypothetical protein
MRGLMARIAEIAGTYQPDAGEGGVELIDQALRDRRKDFLEIKTGCHLERDALQATDFGLLQLRAPLRQAWRAV